MSNLVLSLFPGVGLLDRAFEETGFCVVRGPDLLWGGDVRRFYPPAGVFDGVIGGPPCQAFSRLRHINPHAGRHGNLIPEFERVIEEAQPRWFLMENVPDAPEPQSRGYWPVRPLLLNNRWVGGEQQRIRRFSFSTRFDSTPHGVELDVSPDLALLEPIEYRQAVTSSARAVCVKLVRDGRGGHRPKKRLTSPTVSGGHSAVMSHERDNMSIAEMCRLQGLPEDFLAEAPFTAHGKRKVIGNGVPLPMGRAVARAVRRALDQVEAQQ